MKHSPEIPIWFKQFVTIAGLLLALIGLPMILGLCFAIILALSDDPDAAQVGLVSLTWIVLTFGAGGTIFWHGLRSIQGRVSAPFRLPSVWTLIGLFIFLVITGLIFFQNDIIAGLFLPLILIITSTLPPLLAISWFMKQPVKELTWRRSAVAFAGGMTVTIALTVLAIVTLTTVSIALISNLLNIVRESLEFISDTMAGDFARVSTPKFLYLFAQIAIIIPLIEELTKPLVTFPLIGRLSPRATFLIGAIAGAGFAAIENMIYAGIGLSFWTFILLVRALGCGIQPLGTGLVSVGWRKVLLKKDGAWPTWLIYFSLALGINILWNGGVLLILTLILPILSGNYLPPNINSLGLIAGVTIFILLILLGLSTLWAGRFCTEKINELPHVQTMTITGFKNTTIAMWAILCLLIFVPAGILATQILKK